MKKLSSPSKPRGPRSPSLVHNGITGGGLYFEINFSQNNAMLFGKAEDFKASAYLKQF